MNLWIPGLLALVFVGMGACTKSAPDPDLESKANQEKIQQLESELSVYRERIKTADTDRGLRDQLVEDEALLKSRLERLRERSKLEHPAEAGAPR